MPPMPSSGNPQECRVDLESIHMKRGQTRRSSSVCNTSHFAYPKPTKYLTSLSRASQTATQGQRQDTRLVVQPVRQRDIHSRDQGKTYVSFRQEPTLLRKTTPFRHAKTIKQSGPSHRIRLEPLREWCTYVQGVAYKPL